MRTTACLALLLSSGALFAQVPTQFFSVGSAQVVPDPITAGLTGTFALGADYCGGAGGNQPTIKFTVSGLTTGWYAASTTESCYLAGAIGAAVVPPVTLLQGDFYIPLNSPAGPPTILAGPLPVQYTGPLDTVCPAPAIPATGAPRMTGHGMLGVAWSVPPAATGLTITFQATMGDGVRFYTSNAVQVQF